jgi:glutamate-1-semialdehyde 2,1-aminomutase
MANSSEDLFRRATAVMPGGVNSPVRAWKAVGGNPRFVRSGRGATIRDVDGREYLDYVGSWGPLILGHAHPAVQAAVREVLESGTSFGAPTEVELLLAETVCRNVASIERVRLVNSGTEATMSALRVARAYTGRPEIVKFTGCYHGHVDELLVRAGSGAMTFGVPDSPGVPPGSVELTRLASYNDVDSVRAVVGPQTAAIIVEPVPGNMGLVIPEPGFLAALREICDSAGALLIFDEVITGFRLGLGGYQGLCSIRPDLTCLGKIIGGGLPIGAYGGRADVMELVAPLGPVYQAGTLSGNPLAAAAGFATLRELEATNPYGALEARGAQLERGLAEALGSRPGCVQRVGSMLTLFFGQERVRCYADALRADTARFARFFRCLLAEGIWAAPSQFELWFVSAVHTDEDIERTITAARRAIAASD